MVYIKKFVNSTNLEGKTAWDISQGQTHVNNREIKLMLYSARASSSSPLSIVTRSDDNNINEFYNLIGEDVKLLEHIDELPFINKKTICSELAEKGLFAPPIRSCHVRYTLRPQYTLSHRIVAQTKPKSPNTFYSEEALTWRKQSSVPTPPLL